MSDIEFTCYRYTDGDGSTYTIFLFYPEGRWDSCKSSLEEALDNWPIQEFNWIHFDEVDV